MSEFSALDPQTAVLEGYLLPGELRCAAVPARYTTILGSCIAVCLYDPVSGIGGLNHYLLPGPAPDADPEPLRWSGRANQELFERVLAAGARRDRLQAKTFGGASISPRQVADSLRIGDRNAREALAALLAWHVPLVSHDVGGNTGRKLIFETHTGKAWVKTLVQRTG